MIKNILVVGGAGYIGSHMVKALALAKKDGDTYYGTGVSDVMSGNYPLARFLYVYVNKKPGEPLNPMIREFLKYAMSREGQEVVVKDGYLPIPAKSVEQEIGKRQ